MHPLQERAVERTRARAILIKGESFDTAITALRAFPSVEDIQTEACEVLSRCMDPDGNDAFSDAAVRVASAAIRRFPTNAGIHLSCANLISSAAVRSVSDPQRVMALLVGSVRLHVGNRDVAHNAFCAIRNVARMSEAGAACAARCGVLELAAVHAETCIPAVDTCLTLLEAGHCMNEARAWRDHEGRALEEVIGPHAAEVMRSIVKAQHLASDKALADLLLDEEIRKVRMATLRRKKAERKKRARERSDEDAAAGDGEGSCDYEGPYEGSFVDQSTAYDGSCEDQPTVYDGSCEDHPAVDEHIAVAQPIAPKAPVSSKLKRELWESVVRYCDEDRCVCTTPMCDTCESCAVVRDMVIHARQLFRVLEI